MNIKATIPIINRKILFYNVSTKYHLVPASFHEVPNQKLNEFIIKVCIIFAYRMKKN